MTPNDRNQNIYQNIIFFLGDYLQTAQTWANAGVVLP